MTADPYTTNDFGEYIEYLLTRNSVWMVFAAAMSLLTMQEVRLLMDKAIAMAVEQYGEVPTVEHLNWILRKAYGRRKR